ncbi:MAG TPA: type II toxin-antitoxin system RelE/ParE family toxin [Mycobacteriales bacterium]|nr:type II toxin-antitoxin system RelE/ParE family toxin [Mycobacteriales bacterium]
MTDRPYELRWSRTARKAISERLPEQIAVAAAEFITGPLARNPQRLGKALGAELSGIHAARLLRQWRVLHEIDEPGRRITVLDIRARADAYRRR